MRRPYSNEFKGMAHSLPFTLFTLFFSLLLSQDINKSYVRCIVALFPDKNTCTRIGDGDLARQMQNDGRLWVAKFWHYCCLFDKCGPVCTMQGGSPAIGTNACQGRGVSVPVPALIRAFHSTQKLESTGAVIAHLAFNWGHDIRPQYISHVCLIVAPMKLSSSCVQATCS